MHHSLNDNIQNNNNNNDRATKFEMNNQNYYGANQNWTKIESLGELKP